VDSESEEEEDDGAEQEDEDEQGVQDDEAEQEDVDRVEERYLNLEVGARVNCMWAVNEWYEGVVISRRTKTSTRQKVTFDLDGVTTACRLTNLTCEVLS